MGEILLRRIIAAPAVGGGEKRQGKSASGERKEEVRGGARDLALHLPDRSSL